MEEQPGHRSTADRLSLPEGISPRDAVFGLLTFLAIAFPVYALLFENGGFSEPTDTSGPTLLVVSAGLAVLFGSVLAPRAALRSLVAPAVLALAGLTVLTFIVPLWTNAVAGEVERLGLLTLGYTLLAVAGYALAVRFGALPVLLLLVVTATVAGAMGLWGYATLDETLAGLNQGEFVPQGPVFYRNTLALLCAAALLPLGRWAAPDARSATAVGISIASGLALGVSAITVVLSLSEFALAFSALLVFAVLVWPGPSLGASSRKVLPPLLTAGAIAIAAWVVYRKLLPLPPESDGIRLTLMLILVGLTPLLTWGLSLAADRFEERAARRAGHVLVGLGALALLVVALGPGLSDDSVNVRIGYYEVLVDTLYEEALVGVGPGGYAEASYSSQVFLVRGSFQYAHSIPGEAWVELGLAGLLVSLLLYFAAFRDAWRSRRVPLAALLAPLVLGFLLSGLIDWSWHIPAMTALWAAGLGTVAGLGRRGPVPDATAGPPARVSSNP